MDKIDKLNKYKEYIRQCTSASNSAGHYSDFSRLNKLIEGRYNGFTEILDCDDPDYLQSIYDDLDKLNSFDEFKDEINAGKNFREIGNGQYRNALLTYIRFLRAIKLLGKYYPVTEMPLELKSHKSTLRESFIKYWNIIDQHGAQIELYVNKFETVLNEEIKKLKIGVSDVFKIVDFEQYDQILDKIISNNSELSYLSDINGPNDTRNRIWSTNRHYRNYLEILADNSDLFDIIREERHKIVSRFSKSVGFDKKLLTAMRTKPFLLLAGISGTGKSRIVKQMAFESCPNIDQLRSDKTSPGNYQLIEVKPNWHDSTEVLGYESAITNKYIVTPFVKFLVKAMCHPNVPFFVCMDEMNLAPVEQYFAEFLSVLESRKLVNGTITSEPLIKADIFKKYEKQLKYDLEIKDNDSKSNSNDKLETKDDAVEYGKTKDVYECLKEEGLRIPSNLIAVGTVNMDETTHQFSRKVIDRAMTIEMNIADSEEPFNNFFAGSNDLDYPGTPLPKDLFLPTKVQANEALDKLSEDDKKYLVENIPTLLHSLNSALNGTPFKIAYRVQNELVLYFYELRREEKNVSAEELLARAMDAILMLKVLPRIEGDEELLEKPLEELAKFTANYKQAHAKVEEMQSRLNAHFTSFWP